MRSLVVLLILASLAAAQDVKRVVLALHDAGAAARENNPVHQLFEMPLNYHGMVVRLHDVRRGPPPDAWRPGLRAVLTYLGDTDGPEWLWPWLEEAVERDGLRVMHLGSYGMLGRDPDRLARWLARFGLAPADVYREDALRVRVVFRDRRLCAFEADPRVEPIHYGPRNVSERNAVWVETSDALEPEPRCAPVVVGPWGGIALDPYLAHGGDESQERRWRVDPFAFFRAALGLEGVPAPVPAVRNGRRMLVFHVDGDGFESPSTVGGGGRLSAEVFRDEILTRYALPLTVSVIVRGLTDDYAVTEPTPRMRLAREILALPHVEPASHGVLHPLRWDTGKTWYPALKNYAYDPVGEVADSLAFINRHLVPESKPCRLMLWTGQANPAPDVVRTAPLNLNGGVFRWDRWHDSVGFVTPWGLLHDDGALQVYAGAANENDFDGFFGAVPGAFGHVTETIRNTGAPRILKPANIYCHFYSAERPVRLRTLKRLVDTWAFRKETAPVHASRYVRAVDAAVRGVRITRAENGWTFRDCGACRTMRIDGETRGVDWAKSRGIVGARRMQGALFLHLATPDATVVLAEDAAPAPHVEQANCALRQPVRENDAVTVTATGHHARVLVVAGFRPHEPVHVVLGRSSAPTVADADGRVEVRLDRPGSTRIRVTR